MALLIDISFRRSQFCAEVCDSVNFIFVQSYFLNQGNQKFYRDGNLPWKPLVETQELQAKPDFRESRPDPAKVGSA